MKNIQPRTVLIIDDHPIFREGVRQILNTIDSIDVIAESDSGDSAIGQIDYNKPDIILLDLAMPGLDGLSVLKKIKKKHPTIIVVILTGYNDRAYLDTALKLGANGYILKDSAKEDITQCLATVIKGKLYISPYLGSKSANLPKLETNIKKSFELLTKTEKKVLTKVANFLTSKEIASEMNISFRTVQNHRANICHKMKLKGSHQLMSLARRYLKS